MDVYQKKPIAERAFNNEIDNHTVKLASLFPQSLHILFNGLIFIVMTASRMEVMQELNA